MTPKLPIYIRTGLLRKALPDVPYRKLVKIIREAGVTEGRYGHMMISPALLKEKLPKIYACVVTYVEKDGAQ